MLFGPLADHRQVLSERLADDVAGIPDEYCPIPDPGITLDVFDHFGVVVGCNESFTFAAGRHWQHSDEVRQPHVGAPLELGVLVQEMIDIPGFVADDQIVVAVADDVVEDVEVVDEDLVHPAQRFEAMQIVLARFGFDVPRFARQQGARGMYGLADVFEDTSHRMLR